MCNFHGFYNPLKSITLRMFEYPYFINDLDSMMEVFCEVNVDNDEHIL